MEGRDSIDTTISIVDWLVHEATLFAATGFLIGGLDDLLVDIVYFARLGWRGRANTVLSDLPAPPQPGRLAVFVPAWDEPAVIGAMLTAAIARFDHADYRIFVGTYRNDPATIAAVAAVAAGEPRIRLVIGDVDGPTTKADCLNRLWHALLREEGGADRPTTAVVLHDAEDVVHPAELALYDRLIAGHAVVQLPVLPLVAPRARLVSGHYADEFAEAHAKQLVVRTALGAGLPLAGVGCAIAMPMLAMVAARRGGDPFDAASLTEDYELGLRIAEMGGRAIMARVATAPGGLPIAVHACFPATIDTAVRQKSRWMAGIALAGWDRIGWASAGAIGDHWMRMRDRRAPFAVLVSIVAYLALIGWAAGALLHWWRGAPPPPPMSGIALMLVANAGLLAWRIAMRMAFTGRAYGWREACWAVPRLFVANYIALLAARRALAIYVAMLRGRPVAWDKTDHVFPAGIPARCISPAA